MSKTTKVMASHGVEFLVRLVEKGDPYGHNFCKVHDREDPMVEFYDAANPHSYDFVGSREDAVAAGAVCLGQFVSSYYASTLLENIAHTGGVDLCGHVPKWVIDGDALRSAFAKLDLWQPSPKLPLRQATIDFLKVIAGTPLKYREQAVALLRRYDEEHGGIIVCSWDSQNPDDEPKVWVPPQLAHWSLTVLDKSQELGGRFPNTDPADITLLEAGANAGFPGYSELD